MEEIEGLREFDQQSERMKALEERIARIEGAVFFGPSAVKALRRGSTAPASPPHSQPRDPAPSNPNVTKWL